LRVGGRRPTPATPVTLTSTDYFKESNTNITIPCDVSSVYRTVSRSEGETLAARLDCAYFETSAAEDLSSVTTAFGRVLSDVIRLRDRQTLQVVGYHQWTGRPIPSEHVRGLHGRPNKQHYRYACCPSVHLSVRLS